MVTLPSILPAIPRQNADTTATSPAAEGVDLGGVFDSLRETLNGLIEALPQIVLGVVVFLAAMAVAVWVRNAVRGGAERAGRSGGVAMVLGRLARWAVLIFGVLIALTIVFPSFEVSTLVTALGIGGIAIGFAFQDIFENFLAGILVLWTEPFKVGDQVVYSDFEGTVLDIETRATHLRTYDGRRIVIPNAELFKNAVTVNTAFDKRRSQYDVGVSYDADIEEAKEVILRTLRQTPGVLEDPEPMVRAVDLAGSSVNIRALWWTSPEQADVLASLDAVITEIKKALDAAGIEIPYPQRTVYIEKHAAPEGWSGGGEA